MVIMNDKVKIYLRFKYMFQFKKINKLKIK